MNNNRGFILVFTTVFALGFAMLGLGAVKWSGADHEVASKEKFSAQAFWLADGAVQRAKAKLLQPPSLPYEEQVSVSGLGSSKILSITQTSFDPLVWIVRASGTVSFGAAGIQERFIQAKIVRPVFPSPGTASVTATGVIECQGSGGRNGANCENNIENGTQQDPLLTFYNTFGVTWDQAIAMSTSPVLGNQNNMPALSGITYVKITNDKLSGSHEFSIGTLGGGGLLMLDASPVTYSDGAVKFEGASTFTGIIWIKNASVKLGSNASLFTGMMFVEGTVQGGEVDINAQPSIISPGEDNDIFANAGLDKPMVSSWQECNSDFTQCS